MNTKNIDEVSGTPGSFQKFLEEKKAFLKKIEDNRKARIRAARSSKQMAWAA
jgi:hypothetical protein